MILVGFYLYIFPPKDGTAKTHENEFSAINFDIPAADKKIEEKTPFNQKKEMENERFLLLKQHKIRPIHWRTILSI